MPKKDITGFCVCTNCDFSMPAPKGADCSNIRCPRCGSHMKPGGKGFTPMEVN